MGEAIQALKCIFGRHLVHCDKTIILDEGILQHEHWCNYCPYERTFPEKEIDPMALEVLRMLNSKRDQIEYVFEPKRSYMN